ncbi:hypothetical protein QYB58_000870 [Clostridium perfringens]|nr:hypothetical protein [Clostridium perfringens]
MNKLFKESNQKTNEVKEVIINVFGEPIVFQYTVEEIENKLLPNNKLDEILKPLFESFGIGIDQEEKARKLKIKHVHSRIEDIKLNIKVLGAKDGIELYEGSYGADIISKKAREKYKIKESAEIEKDAPITTSIVNGETKTLDYKEAMRKVFGKEEYDRLMEESRKESEKEIIRRKKENREELIEMFGEKEGNELYKTIYKDKIKDKLKEQEKELAEIEAATVTVTINGETKTLPAHKKLPKVNKLKKLKTLKKESKVKEKKINVMVDSKSYEGAGDAFKDEVLKKNAGAITDRIALKIVTVKELIKYASNGHAIRPAIFDKVGNELSDNFKGIQALFIDVDEENSINDSLRIAKENNINVAGIVPSVRFTEENQKHRIILILDKPIFDERIAKQLITELIQLFHADKQCKNLKRFYFGSCNKPLHVDYNAINNVENLMKITKIAETKTAETVDMTNLEADNNSEFETTHILNLYNNIYKINKGGESNNLYEYGSKLDKSMLDRLFEDEIFVKTYGFKSFNNMEEIKKYLKAIPLEHLLQIENPSSFNCILHEDNNPSAAIKMIDNVSIYSCFSDGCIGTSNDIFNIVSYVLYKTTDRFMDAFSYIVTVLNITVKDIDLDFYKRIIEIIKNNRYLALTSNNLGEEFKNVKRKLNSKYTNMLLRTLMDIAEYTLDCCPQINKGKELIFTASSSFLQDKAGFSSKKMIQERIDDLVAIGFIEQLTDQEVKNININVYNSINALQKKNFYEKAKTINCYRLKRVDTKALAEAEELFKYSKQIGATRKGTSALQNNIVGIEARKKESGSFAGKNKNMFEKLRGWFHRTYKRNKYILKHAYLSYASKNNIGEKKASQFLSYLNSELGLSKKVVSKDLINELKIPTTNIRKTVFI